MLALQPGSLMGGIRQTIRDARGRRVSVDAAVLLEVVDAGQRVRDLLMDYGSPVVKGQELEQLLERWEIAVITLSGSVGG